MRALLVLALAAVVAACSSPVQTPPDASEEASAAVTAAASPAASATPAPESPVAGVVIAVDSGGLNDVRGFTLRSSVGDDLVFTLGELENGDEFPPGHLAEHLAAASPVLVFFRNENGQLVVYRIEDAG